MKLQIHKNVPIPPLRKNGMLCYRQLEIYASIVDGTMGVGDMVEMSNDCATLRQKLYDGGYRITVRFNVETGKYNVWRTK